MLTSFSNYKEISRVIRLILKAKGKPWPIKDIDGFDEPRIVGYDAFWTTPSGKTVITHPNAYKWRKVYHGSTKTIVVGRGWLIQNGLV